MLRVFLLCIAIAVSTATSHAQDIAAAKTEIELSGIGGATIVLTPESLRALPAIEQDVTFQTSKGPSTGRYKGVLFWDVLVANKAFADLEHNAELKDTFVVTGRDGYQIAFSVGEIHPEFGNTPMMIATEVDGKPFADGLRVIVPGDKRGARNVRQVVKIELH